MRSKPNDQRGFVHKRLIGAALGLFTGGPTAAIRGFIGGGGGGISRDQATCNPNLGDVWDGQRCIRVGGGGAPGIPFSGFAPTRPRGGFGGFESIGKCGFGQKRDPITGECRFFFGQQPGPEPGGVGGGQAVAGGFNMPAFTPDVVGNISRMDGSSGPILRCPRGTVLATDNLCYAKGTKGLAVHRKWKPTPRGFLPRKDVVCLRRAVAIRENKSNRKMFKELGLG